MCLQQRIRLACIQRADSAQDFDQALRVTWHQQGGIPGRVTQHQILQQEFQVDQAARALLQVEARRIAAVQFRAHAQAHAVHVLAQFFRIARLGQCLLAHAIERIQQRAVTGHATRAHQRLVLPGPGTLTLVIAIAGQ